jgi:peptidyl-prolyl cis-trans isomerase A (cyclophilin A)
MKRSILLLALLCFLAPALPAEEPALKLEDPSDPLVLMKTSKGDIVIELFEQEAPKTVANFLGLATGTKEFTDCHTSEKTKRPFYDGLVFHRVIDKFMIQGGCPLGNGTGGPGYTFEDEINAKALGLDKLDAVDMSNPNQPKPHPYLLIRSQQQFQQMLVQPVLQKLGITSNEEVQQRMDEVLKAIDALSVMDVYENIGYLYSDKLKSHAPKRGTLAMANSGPNTNGSQFFINTVDNDYLTGKHTVFGKVVKGMDVVDAIGAMPTDKTKERVKIVSIRPYQP